MNKVDEKIITFDKIINLIDGRMPISFNEVIAHKNKYKIGDKITFKYEKTFQKDYIIDYIDKDLEFTVVGIINQNFISDRNYIYVYYPYVYDYFSSYKLVNISKYVQEEINQIDYFVLEENYQYKYLYFSKEYDNNGSFIIDYYNQIELLIIELSKSFKTIYIFLISNLIIFYFLFFKMNYKKKMKELAVLYFYTFRKNFSIILSMGELLITILLSFLSSLFFSNFVIDILSNYIKIKLSNISTSLIILYSLSYFIITICIFLFLKYKLNYSSISKFQRENI